MYAIRSYYAASESDVQHQVEMLNNAMAKKPVAIALAALNTTSVIDQLEQTKKAGIPVIGFDSGVPNAPKGSIYANASTDVITSYSIHYTKLYDFIFDECHRSQFGEAQRNHFV